MTSYEYYEVFENDDLGFIFSEIYAHLLDAYSLGLLEARIFIRSELAHCYLARWMPGWVRKAGPNGVWVNSQGKHHYENFS